MIIQRVFVDANVLYSRTLRDWLFMLRNEIEGMFQLHTSRDVIVEVLYQLRRNHQDMDGGVIVNLHDKITAAVDEILDDFDASISYTGEDPNDRHVHAAAVACAAQILLTEDAGLTSDDETTYEVWNCDDFFVLIDDSAGWFVERVVRDQHRYWSARPGRPKSIVKALEDARCPQFAKRVAKHLRTLSGPPPR
ncbi:PIN domain-containing protein [Amnibacterium flavum]|uniref:PIN domain-containing protein n=1 Tax=Amnibacterium flavum TaxID=2173173 RepID=A0A2V1HNN8_9MICO|nr:PIN domain-containing protein [Amnibacterium flavum]PVZ93192.1 PIN domain-containing protein [Amnibacterium flavum]